jgi:hypothetical protein
MTPQQMGRTFITPVQYMTAEVRGRYARPQLFRTLYVSPNERRVTSPASPPTKTYSKRHSRTSSRPKTSSSTSRYIEALEGRVQREKELRTAAEAKLERIDKPLF